jgi:hypothetical protein
MTSTTASPDTTVWDAFVAAAVKRGAASASTRRFIVVTVVTKVINGRRVPTGVPAIFKRSDSIDTAKAHARKSGTWAVVVDKTTGARV